MRALVFLLSFSAAQVEAATVASGRNWRLAIESIECADSLLVIGTRIDYRGPSGPVEAPVIRLADDKGKFTPPKSLVWKSGSKELAELLPSGGLRNIASGNSSEIQLRFEARDAGGELKLEFGDIEAFSLTRKGCKGVLKPEQIQAPRAARGARSEGSKLGPVYRARYPCRAGEALRTISADHPPYLPRQLLVLGRGYLPNARRVELPMGSAAAQSYAYSGLDDLKAVEDAARKAVAADFPQYLSAKYFAFNWGAQKAQSNEVYSIGLYELRPCPK